MAGRKAKMKYQILDHNRALISVLEGDSAQEIKLLASQTLKIPYERLIVEKITEEQYDRLLSRMQGIVMTKLPRG
jgi:hypothetical protein